jgi:hypothetical protein
MTRIVAAELRFFTLDLPDRIVAAGPRRARRFGERVGGRAAPDRAER